MNLPSQVTIAVELGAVVEGDGFASQTSPFDRMGDSAGGQRLVARGHLLDDGHIGLAHRPLGAWSTQISRDKALSRHG